MTRAGVWGGKGCVSGARGSRSQDLELHKEGKLLIFRTYTERLYIHMLPPTVSHPTPTPFGIPGSAHSMLI